jgi:hypothetical protein
MEDCLFSSIKCHILHLLTLIFISKANYHIVAKKHILGGQREEDTTKLDIKHLLHIYINLWNFDIILGISVKNYYQITE